MSRERVELLMNRAIDGALSDEDREHLARALNADPLLRSEYEELQTTNASLESMFRQVALPLDFSSRVMRRVRDDIQDGRVPADMRADSVRLDPVSARSSRLPLSEARQGARQVRMRSAQRKVRIYATVATISAAAALLLALGVMTNFFSRTAPNTGAPRESTLAEDRGGVPRTEGDNRTDPSRSTPKGGEAPKPNGEGASHASSRDSIGSGAGPDNESLPPIVPDESDKGNSGITEKPDSSNPGAGNGADSGANTPEQPQPENPGTPIDPDPLPPSSPEIDNGKPDPTDDRKTTGTAPVSPERVKFGRMMVLSGKAEVEGTDGKWTLLADDSEVHSGSRMRMNVNGLALIQTENGNVALGKGARVRLADAATVSVEEGNITLERGERGQHSGNALVAILDEYRFDLHSGFGVVARKKQGFEIHMVLGTGQVSHNLLGTMAMAAGTEFETTFAAKSMKEPRQAPQQLPDWCGDSRAIAVLAKLESDLTAREFNSRERRDLDRNLRSALERLLAHAVSAEAVVSALQYAIANRKLSGSDLVKVVKELETAMAEATDIAPDAICGFAGRAALVAESQAEWRDFFYRLMRPAAPAGGTSGSSSSSSSGVESSDNKLRRVDSPSRK